MSKELADCSKEELLDMLAELRAELEEIKLWASIGVQTGVMLSSHKDRKEELPILIWIVENHIKERNFDN